MGKPLLVTLFAAGWISVAGAQTHRQSRPTAEAHNDAPLLRSTDPGAARFKPVGQLAAASPCTATLIAGAGIPSESTPALVLTAGHCVEIMTENRVIVDQPADPAWTFTPAFYVDTQPQHVPFRVSRVLYATMKGMDIAVLRLDATYGDLARIGVGPMRLRTDLVAPGTAVELAHVPTDGVPPEEQFLRLSTCMTRAPGTVYEERADRHPWLWTEAIANDCKGVAGGTSGAPVVLVGSSAVVGVLNTTVSVEFNGCGVSRPCELEEATPVSREATSYQMPLYRIAQALRADSTFDTTRLDPGTGVIVRRVGRWATRSLTDDGNGGLEPARWNLRVDGVQLVRYKVGPAGNIGCDLPDGYSEPLPAEQQPLSRMELPANEGVYAACVIGRRDNDAPWQSMDHAAVMLREIDDTSPQLVPRIELFLDATDSWLVYGGTRRNEISSFMIKYGPRDTTDCQSGEGYFFPIGFWEQLDKAQAPWRFCVVGADLANNPSPVTFRDFDVPVTRIARTRHAKKNAPVIRGVP